MTKQQQQLDWEGMRRKAGPYPIEAFDFVRDGLTYTIERLRDDALAPARTGGCGSREELQDEDRHITGQQLCLGLRDFAIEQYGLLAPAVLDHWFIRRTDDFGRIVFAMVDSGLMSKTEDDTAEDFRAVYDFSEAFSRESLLARMGR